MTTRIDRIELKNFRMFAELSLTLHPELTVLVAPNGGGKTAILDALATAWQKFVAALASVRRDGRIVLDDVRLVIGPERTMEIVLPTQVLAMGIVDEAPTRWSRHIVGVDEEAVQRSSRARHLLDVAASLRQRVIDYTEGKRPDAPTLPVLCYYGTGRLWNRQSPRERDATSRFSGYTRCLSSASGFRMLQRWFRRFAYEAQSELSSHRASPHRPRERIEAVRFAVDRLLAPSGWQQLEWDFAEDTLVATHPEHGRLPVRLLSDGIRTMIGMVGDLAQRCVRLNPHFGSQAASQTPGVVLIDEIDMHLHPAWQQTIAASLREAFPRVQFIVTTHSHLVISTVPGACVRILQPDGTVSQPILETEGAPRACVREGRVRGLAHASKQTTFLPVTTPDLHAELRTLCARARAAARALAPVGRAEKDRALRAIAERLRESAGEGARSAVLLANAEDVEAARAAGLSEALVDRLLLNAARLHAIADAVLEIAAFDDPVGEVVGMRRRPNGLLIGQVRIPLGVIAMIYESRPNVTVDAAALCLKSGNAAILRGGKEAARSNEALAALVREAVRGVGLPADAVQLLPSLDREATKVLVSLSGLIDLAIPRGGEGLIRFVAEHARVPVIQHYKGVCHLYVDAEADLDMAFRLVENGKLQRPGVCNALECLLVHERVAAPLLARVAALIPGRGLELRGDEATCALVPAARRAEEADWGAEFLAPILASRVVSSLDEAMDHIARYGSNHTEAICTTRYDHAQRFLREVDASCVLVNASTRFNDGGELGLGAEIGISTTKLHAYGPMGLASLTALKWLAYGEGQTR